MAARFPGSMTARVLVGALVIAALVWLILDRTQSRALRAIYTEEITQRLEIEALQDRLRFDEGVRSHAQGVSMTARLNVVTEAFARMRRADGDWDDATADPPPVAPSRQENWLPDRSLLRSNIVPDFLLALDTKSRIRRAFSPFNTPLPDFAAKPLPLIVAKSKEQSLIADIGQIPYLIASHDIVAPDGTPLGVLVSLTRIGTRFLNATQKGFLNRDGVVVLTRGEGGPVLASSDQVRVPTGTIFSAIEKDYIVTGKAYFDYGSSEIQTHFLTIMPKSVFDRRLASVLQLGRGQRTVMAGVFTALLLVFLLYIAHRIRQFKAEVLRSARRVGVAAPPDAATKDDELDSAIGHFRHLIAEVEAGRRALEKETEQKVAAIRERAEARQEIDRLTTLRDIANSLGIGVIDRAHGALKARTETMNRFFRECGGAAAFSTAVPGDDLVIASGPCKGRIFQISHPTGLHETLLLVQDVTEQRRFEGKIRSLALFPSQNPNPVLRSDGDGVVILANDASKPLLAHWTIAEGGKLPPDLRASVRRALDEKRLIEYEVAAGTRRFFLTLAPAESPEGRHVNLYGLDITARTAAEDALRQARDELELRVAERTASLTHEIERRKETERALIDARDQAETANRAKSDFLAAMSHELRTPLNAIIGFSDMMSSQALGPIDNPTYVDYLRDIHDSGQHLLTLINDILDVSKIEAGKMTVALSDTSLLHLLEKARRLTIGRAALSNVDIAFDIPDDPGPVRVDERRATQAVINLLSNAVKFSPPDSVVSVRAEIDGPFVAISVVDRGIGMTEEECAKVLRPFVQVDQSLQRRYEGTGLGLFLAKSFVEMMGGSLALHSKKGEGTTAILRFPRA